MIRAPLASLCLQEEQGLVANGAKVYVTALAGKDLDDAMIELKKLGETSGGSAIGYAPDDQSLLCPLESKTLSVSQVTYPPRKP